MSDAVIFAADLRRILRAPRRRRNGDLLLHPSGGRPLPQLRRGDVSRAVARLERMLPRFRTSWCYECGWHGMLRQRPAQSGTDDRELTKLS